MKKNKGFTLIELLVVIAIIGILASVVLASLSSARNKGADAAIKSNLANMRAQAEIYLDSRADKTYTSFCSDPTYLSAKAAIQASNNNAAVNCTADSNEWAISAVMKADNTKFWCVDYLGSSKEETATNATTDGSIKCS